MEKRKRSKIGKSPVTWAAVIVLCTLLVIYSLILISSLLWGFMTSLKDPREFSDLDFLNVMGLPTLDRNVVPNSWDEVFRLENYRVIIENLKYDYTMPFYMGQTEIVHEVKDIGLLGMLGNTVLYTVGGALIYATIPCMTAYLCAKYDEFKLSGIIFVVYLFMMSMPIVGSYPTELTFLRNIGIYDTIWGNYIQKMTGSGMYFFVYYAYFKGVSNTYREAAEIDGASQLRVMVTIYFPLAIKMISTVFLIQFVTLWNDYQTPLMYLPTHPTLAFGIYILNTGNGSGEELRKLYYTTIRMAGCMMLAVPITIIFVIFKERLMGDVSLGGIKE